MIKMGKVLHDSADRSAVFERHPVLGIIIPQCHICVRVQNVFYYVTFDVGVWFEEVEEIDSYDRRCSFFQISAITSSTLL